jgi:hypothetical protein
MSTAAPVASWGEQCSRCGPAARAMREQLEEAREHITELESQLRRLQLEVKVLHSHAAPKGVGAQSLGSTSGVPGAMAESSRSELTRHGMMVPYRPNPSMSECGGLPFSTVSSVASAVSRSTARGSSKPRPAYPGPPLSTPRSSSNDSGPEGAAAIFSRLLKKEFWTGEDARTAIASGKAAVRVQACVRGWQQRARFRAAREVFGVVSGISTYVSPSSKRTVPTYTVTVVRAGCCWQVVITR